MIVQQCWSIATSSDDNWTPDNPALGQCAVTALFVQELLGGDLLRSTVNGVSHYWNRLIDGTEIDLTRDQFADFHLDAPPEVRPRAYVLSYEATAIRYQILMLRMVAGLLAWLTDEMDTEDVG